MNTKFFQDHLKKLNFNSENEIIKKFTPIISQDFEKDKINFSSFWQECEDENKKVRDKKEKKKIRSLVEVTKKIFLNDYASNIYNRITDNRE